MPLLSSLMLYRGNKKTCTKEIMLSARIMALNNKWRFVFNIFVKLIVFKHSDHQLTQAINTNSKIKHFTKIWWCTQNHFAYIFVLIFISSCHLRHQLQIWMLNGTRFQIYKVLFLFLLVIRKYSKLAI